MAVSIGLAGSASSPTPKGRFAASLPYGIDRFPRHATRACLITLPPRDARRRRGRTARLATLVLLPARRG